MAYFLTLCVVFQFIFMRRYIPIILSLTTLFVTGCRHHRKSHTDTPPLAIYVAQARADSVALRYEFTTHLESGFDAVIQPRVNGYLLQSNLQAGRPVKRGELLFVLDANLLNTSLLSAEAQLRSAEAKEREARKNYERAKPLAELNAISRTQMDEYEATYIAAQQSVKAARQQVQSARLQVGYSRIYSPIDGIAAATDAHIGDYVGEGTQFSTLTTISNMDSLKAELSLPTATYLQSIERGQPLYDNRNLLSDITLYLDDGTQYEHRGVYDYTRQSISPSAGTITLVTLFPNPDYRLKVGEYARIECNVGPLRRRILLPQQAVQSVQGVHSVWVIESDSTAHYRKVTIGNTLGRDYIIEEGITEGEVVALTGAQKLHNGMKVIPLKSK